MECREDKVWRLKGRGFRQDNDSKARYAKTLQGDGGVNDVAERANAKEIDGAMRDEDDGKDAQGLPGGRVVPIHDFSCCGDQVCEREIYGGSNGDLAEEVEPW